MIEAIIISALEDALTDTPVVAEVPKDMPEQFVLIERTGGSCLNHVTNATVAVQSYAPSMLEAAALNEQVRTAVEALPAVLAEVGGVRIISPGYNFTDSRTKKYRYQMVADIYYIEV